MSYEELLTELALTDERFIVMTAENRALIRKLPQLLGNRFIAIISRDLVFGCS